MAWPTSQSRTKRNRYAVTPLLVTCIVLRRLASACRWSDLESLLCLHTSHLSEIFWEGLMNFVSHRASLLMDDVQKPFWNTRYNMYAEAVSLKSNALSNVVASLDGTNQAISRPSGREIDQRVAYNGHKRKHCLKYQDLTTACGLAMHLADPTEGRRHDWTLYLSSGLDSTLGPAFLHDGKQFVAYGDARYSTRPYLYVPFSGSHLTPERRAFNTAMEKSRVTEEWYFCEVKRYWTMLDVKRSLRVKECGVGALYISGVLLTNLRNCCHPNSISQYFACLPPSMAEYVNHRN